MNNILFSLAEVTLSMSLVILLLMGLFRLVGKKIKASSKYIIWMLVVFRLAVPFFGIASEPLIELYVPEFFAEELPSGTVNDNNEGGGFNNENDSFMNEVPSLPQNGGITPDTGNNLGGNNQNIGNTTSSIPVVNNPSDIGENIIGGTDEDKQSTEQKENSVSLAEAIPVVIFSVWLAGAVIFFGVNIVKYNVFANVIRRTAVTPDARTYGVYKNVCAEMGLKKLPQLMVSRGVNGPMMFGYLRKTVVVPQSVIEDGDISLRNVVSHELTHYERKDLCVKLVALVSGSLNWFNPFVYIAISNMNSEMELSCDECVLEGLSEEGKINYGRTLIAVADRSRSFRTGLSTCFDPKRSSVKKRINNILDSANKKRAMVLIVLVLAVCITVGLIFGISTSRAEKGTDKGDSTDVGDVTTGDIDDSEGKKEPQINAESGILATFSDGSTVEGTSDGKLLIIKDGFGEHNISSSVDAGEGKKLLQIIKGDFDNDNSGEYAVVLSDENYFAELCFVDGVAGSYKVYKITKDELTAVINKRIKYSWDKENEIISVEMDGKHITDIRLKGAMSQSGAKLIGIDYNIDVVALDNKSVGVNISDNGKFRIDVIGRFTFDGDARCKHELKANVSIDSLYADGGTVDYSDMSVTCWVKGVNSKHYNTEYISNSTDWRVYGDIDGNVVVVNKNNEYYRFGNDFRSNETENNIYTPIYQPLDSEAPELYVSSDSKYVWLIFSGPQYAIGDYDNRAAILVPTESASALNIKWNELDNVNSEFMFEKHGVSQEIRSLYNHRSLIYAPDYYMDVEIKEISSGVFRKTYYLLSYDGTMALNGYMDYDFNSGSVSKYNVGATDIGSRTQLPSDINYQNIAAHMRLLVDYVYDPIDSGDTLAIFPIENYLLWYCYFNRDSLGFVRTDDVYFYVKENDLKKMAEVMFGSYVELHSISSDVPPQGAYNKETGEYKVSFRTDYYGGKSYQIKAENVIAVEKDGALVKATATVSYYGNKGQKRDRILEYIFANAQYNGFNTYRLVSVADVTPEGVEMPLSPDGSPRA